MQDNKIFIVFEARLNNICYVLFKARLKFSLCLNEHQIWKTCGGMKESSTIFKLGSW